MAFALSLRPSRYYRGIVVVRGSKAGTGSLSLRSASMAMCQQGVRGTYDCNGSGLFPACGKATRIRCASFRMAAWQQSQKAMPHHSKQVSEASKHRVWDPWMNHQMSSVRHGYTIQSGTCHTVHDDLHHARDRGRETRAIVVSCPSAIRTSYVLRPSGAVRPQAPHSPSGQVPLVIGSKLVK
ncbi:hypothetical protein VTK73DRAFT_938 [Phialemonium thermophilum]|uniref:Uncharacterized protein n=1 Tax=Phialemonium thermophilum TaxID=223376 RepID=A0ABR3VU54_9PEZI